MREGWEVKKLGEIITLEYGKPLQNEKRVMNGLYPVYGANGEKSRTNEYYHDKKSIIIGRKGSAGEVNLTEEKFWPLDVTYYVKYNDKICSLNFLFYLLSNLGLKKFAKGVKPGINRNEVYDISINFPPLPEQERIVSILDEAFAAIAKAKENAERNLQNAKDLFESYLQSVFSNRGEGWEEKRLGEVCEKIFAGGDVPKNNFSHEKTKIYCVPIFSNGATNKGLYGYTDLCKVTKPSITISARGTIGYSEIRRENFYPIIRLIVLTPKTDLVDISYLKYSLNLLEFSNSGTSIPQLTVPMIKEYYIPLPTMTEQQRIVTILDLIKEKTQRLQSIYTKKIIDLEELKKSILNKAFQGELSAKLLEEAV